MSRIPESTATREEQELMAALRQSIVTFRAQKACKELARRFQRPTWKMLSVIERDEIRYAVHSVSALLDPDGDEQRMMDRWLELELGK